MEQISECVIPPRDESVPDTALLTRIRDSVIGDDQADGWGRTAPRRVTYADYTASGRALSVRRGLHPRRGAAALRQHAHRVAAAPGCRPRGCARTRARIIHDGGRRRRRHAVIFCGSGSTGAIDKLVGVLDLRIPADLDDRYGLAADGSRRTSGRSCSSARTSTTPTSCRGASRSPTWSPSARTPTATSTSTAARRRARTPRRPAAEDRLVLARPNVTGIVSATRAASPRCCTTTARCPSGTSRPRRRTSTST